MSKVVEGYELNELWPTMNGAIDIDALWGTLPFGPETIVKFMDEPQSPRMHISEVLITLQGVQVKVWWCHEGNIRSEWVNPMLLEEVSPS